MDQDPNPIRGLNWNNEDFHRFNVAMEVMPPEFKEEELELLEVIMKKHKKPREEVHRVYEAYLLNKSGVFNDLPSSRSKEMSKSTRRWTEEEEGLFHQGLKEVGHKWNKISTDYVVSKSEMQVCNKYKSYMKKMKKSAKNVQDQSSEDVENSDTTAMDT